MLREVRNAGFARRLTPLGWRWHVVHGGRAGSVTWRAGRMRAMRARQREEPVALFRRDGRTTWWWFEDRLYREDDGLAARDVLALVRERERRRRRTLDRAHAALAADAAPPRPRREHVPRDVRLAVWRRDGGRCVACGSGFDLQYDHVIPVALGGASTVENLQVLCAACNRRKGAAL